MSCIYSDVSFETKTLDVDLCVVGGGMAGLCAAVAAARSGVRVALVQDRPVLGGNASSEIRMWICGARGWHAKEGGLLEEILLDNYYYNPGMKYPIWDHILYSKCHTEPNLTLLLNAAVTDLTMDGSRIANVTAWHLTEQCWYTIAASQFADCSGDSVLRISGAEYRWGREGRAEFDEEHAVEEADRVTMGNSILIQLREVEQHIPFIPPTWARTFVEEDLPCRKLTPQGHNFWWLELGGLMDTISDADAIRDEALAIAYGAWDLIKNHPDGRGKNWELEWIGSLPGKRENVRYVGDHILTQNDVEAEGRFDDVIGHGGWPMDDHHPAAIEHKGEPTIYYPAPSPYGIPLRCLYSRNISNLWFAGRNISATHMALSSTRVMGTTSVMGQAVGMAAALACREGLTPREVYEQRVDALQQMLMDQDVFLPWKTRPLSKLLQSAALSSSNDGEVEPLLNGVERIQDDSDNGWWGESGASLCWTFNSLTTLTHVRLVCDSDFSNSKRMPCSFPAHADPAQLPSMLLKDAEILIQGADGCWALATSIENNWHRLLHMDFGPVEIMAVKLVIQSTWGGGAAHVYSFEVS